MIRLGWKACAAVIGACVAAVRLAEGIEVLVTGEAWVVVEGCVGRAAVSLAMSSSPLTSWV